MLVAFWFSKVNTFKSGVKVLFYNRVGDFFFFVSLGLLLSVFKTDHLPTLGALSELLDLSKVSLMGLLSLKFFVAFSLALVVVSKSAQYGFHIWLLEAMEAPLPASALIHSATLICSGVVLFFKSSELIFVQSEVSLMLLAWSSLTACFLSFSAFYNYDIKRILAYSTGSHVSVMLALSITYTSYLGYLYMLIHASTKVFIFILFGYIIDLNNGIRDLRKMGGFFFKMDVIFYSIWGLCLLSSLPFFMLPFLKDSLLLKLPSTSLIVDLSIFFFMLSSLFNYLYIVRLYFKIFFGDKLSLTKTYFSNFIFFKSSPLFFYKPYVYKNWLNPLFFIFLYILLVESNFLNFFESNFMHVSFNSFSLSQFYVAMPLLKFYAYSNVFFFFCSLRPHFQSFCLEPLRKDLESLNSKM